MVPETGYAVNQFILLVGDVRLADILIANKQGDEAAAEHDADFIQVEFENNIGRCSKPSTELTRYDGLVELCTPVNCAVNEFMRTNYPSTGSE